MAVVLLDVVGVAEAAEVVGRISLCLGSVEEVVATRSRRPCVAGIRLAVGESARCDEKEIASAADVPFTTLMPAFLTSELKSAFTIGFMIYIPFVVIDLIVASVLMSMGMMMLSPMIISMPFKLMLFVLVDGWTLLMGSLASSFIFK